MNPFFALLAIPFKKLLFILCLVPSLIIKMITTKKGGTKQACAVCKYQRRKCEKNCKLAKYFPADQPKIFQNVHRLFGVRGILKLLDSVDDDQKDIAMNTVILESNMRTQHPVHGCWGFIFRLQHQLQASMEELRQVNQQLVFCKRQRQYQTQASSSNDFCVKPFIKIDQKNPNYYSSTLNHMPLGIQCPLLSQGGIPVELEEMESIFIQDDHHMAHFSNTYTETKAKEVSDSSSSKVESKDSEIPEVATKNKHKSVVLQSASCFSLISVI